jgi:2-polyprenyl-3-methyl-5-hydroxy-6-metoxy-1,4-benzoquinol methylase
MRIVRRAAGDELMDQPVPEAAELARALHDLRAVNRWLGGWRVLRVCMQSLLDPLPVGSYMVLDVGTGSGDLPLRLVRWARARRYHLHVLATDTHPQTLDFARELTANEPQVEVGWANALALPFGDGEFDFATCSTTLHHFDGEQAVRVLQEMDRVTRRGIVINDLRRSSIALLGARLLAVTAWRRSRLTRHDGPLSVRRAYTAAELRALADQAGLPDARVRQHIPFRLSLVNRPALRA